VAGVARGQDYCGFSPQHTMCRYSGVGPSCGPLIDMGVGDKERDMVLDYHNRLRSRVASGSTGQPPAENMVQLQWDSELARVAQRLADQCKFQHDCSDCRRVQRFRVGQNIYQSFNTRSEKNDWTAAIDSWFNEIKIFPSSSVSNYKFASATGHYSQMMWAKTSRIGCGVTSFRSGRFISRLYVCNYGESGNVLRQPVYRIGTPCSACSGSCSADYPGLCTSASSAPSPPSSPDTSCHTFMCMIQKPMSMAGSMAMETAHTVGGTAMSVAHGAMDTVGTLTNFVAAGGQNIVDNGIKPVNNFVFNNGIRPVNNFVSSGFNFVTRPFFQPIRFPRTFFG